MTFLDDTRVPGRRRFVAGAAAPLGALALVGRAGAPAASAPDPAPILTRTLGRTGLRLPIVSMGVMNASAHALVERSFERGVRHFDTAWFYQRGMNETMVGDVVRRLGCREQVVIGTKIFLKETERDLYAPGIKALFLERFAQSLERLKTPYVDILYYHAASSVKELDNTPVLEAFQELRQAGKVRFCGVSFHGDQAAMLDDMRRTRFFDVALVIFNAAMGHPEIAGGQPQRLLTALEAAADSGIGLVAMKTQCGGGGAWAARQGGGQLGEINHTALLKWVLRHPFVTTAIPGYTSFEQMEQNLSVARGLDYTPAEQAFLAREGLRLAESFCAQCGSCREQCPRGVDVPTLMRAHMYAHGYRNLELALATHATLGAAVGTESCSDCGSCSVRCPRRIDVPSRLAEVHQLMGARA